MNTELEEDDFVMPDMTKPFKIIKTEPQLQQVTVKFYTVDAKVFTKSFKTYFTIAKIKSNFVDLFGVPYNVINIQYKDEDIADNVRLEHFKPDKFGILEFKLLSKDVNHKIKVENAYKDLTIPDILTVTVLGEDGMKEIVVEIENQAIEKPHLGGYRHVETGVQYFHGYTQTGPPKPKIESKWKNHRDTQTYSTRNRVTNQEYATATQMTNTNIWIPNITDRIVLAKPYETAEEREARINIEGKVRIIQRYFRAWKMKMSLKALHEEYWKRMRLQEEREQRDRLEDEERKRKDLVSKVFPISAADFSMLYTMVERWKKSEIDRISAYHCGAAKITEFSLLLDKEIELLQSIDKIRQKVRKDIETKKVVDFFKSIGSPLEWDSEYKSIHIQMDTLETQKGREFFALFKSVSDRNLAKEDRIEVLQDLKHKLSQHQCNEKTQLIQLIDRVCEMLARGINENHLIMLQKRIEALLLHHFKLPECNEGVTEHLNKVKLEKMNENMIYCDRCGKLKTIDAFTLNARLEKVNVCKACKWLDKVEQPWIDLSPYRFILKQIRKYERLQHSLSSVSFILQDRDIYHLVVYIWHGHSALSECTDIYQLRLARWKRDEEWTPWNCILLTVDEAKAHLKIEELHDVYEEEFFNHIFNKHALAKKHFSQLMKFDKHFTENTANDATLTEEFWMKKPSAHCLKFE